METSAAPRNCIRMSTDTPRVTFLICCPDSNSVRWHVLSQLQKETNQPKGKWSRLTGVCGFGKFLHSSTGRQQAKRFWLYVVDYLEVWAETLLSCPFTIYMLFRLFIISLVCRRRLVNYAEIDCLGSSGSFTIPWVAPKSYNCLPVTFTQHPEFFLSVLFVL